jgi:hypothetical protein
METQLSRKFLRNIIILVVILIAGILAYSAYMAFFTPRESQENELPPASADSPALQALVVLYSPNPDQPEQWMNNVCQGMTTDGCELFRSLYAPSILNGGDQGQDATASVTVQNANVEDFGDGRRIWLTKIEIGKEPIDVYIEVELLDTQWYLRRVLFQEEATRYTVP